MVSKNAASAAKAVLTQNLVDRIESILGKAYGYVSQETDDLRDNLFDEGVFLAGEEAALHLAKTEALGRELWSVFYDVQHLPPVPTPLAVLTTVSPVQDIKAAKYRLEAQQLLLKAARIDGDFTGVHDIVSAAPEGVNIEGDALERLRKRDASKAGK